MQPDRRNRRPARFRDRPLGCRDQPQRIISSSGRETDSPLEEDGFEPAVSLAMELVSLAEGEGAGEVERGRLEKR